MFPNLLDATQEYWQKLDRLEADYQEGKVSLEEVDAEVARLMAELGQKRRESISYFLQSLKSYFKQQKEIVIGVAVLGIISYAWLLTNSLS